MSFFSNFFNIFITFTISLSVYAFEDDSTKLNEKVFDEYLMVKDHNKTKVPKSKAKAYIFNTHVRKSNYTKLNVDAVYVDPY
jgi:hypothetical protein